MKLTKNEWLRSAARQMIQNRVVVVLMAIGLLGMAMVELAWAQAVSTTTVQGTVYLANGQPGAGTLHVSWPAFTTANGQTVVADSTNVTIGADGFVSVNLAPNLGAMPAGLYYTAVFYMSDGSVSTQYWVIPAAAQVSLGQVQAQVVPAAQAVQAVSKAYVDQSISQLAQSLLTASGGTLSGPLYLSGDPTQALQAADKHYVDSVVGQTIPASGGAVTGSLTALQLGAAFQVDQFPGADFGAKLQACLNGLSTTYGGTCDARNFSGTLAMGSNVTIATGNTTVQLPCATIATAKQVIVTAGTRNVALRGCALRGGSAASGSQGGTVFVYSGTGAMVQVGDATYATDTQGFHLDNVVINTTVATSATAEGLVAYRTQEMDLESLYFLGNSNQTGMTLDGTGNYTGGTFYDNAFNGFQTAVNAIGHQVANSATTDWVNASTFVRLHIDCPTSGGNPIAGTYGINLQQGDGNSLTGGDVEGCSTALHLGSNAQNNTIVGLRNENSSSQVVADTGSAYNNWITGGTMFTGRLTDNGTRNSFLDTFHRSFNGMNGDWYGSQQDATVTNHYRLGTATGNERGLLNRYQTDYGYRWTMGLSDATGGEQFYQVLDELNNVYRLSIGQYNNGQASTNNQTVINSAGTGAVVLNGSTNSGTGGVVIGSGGSTPSTAATISNAGNAQFNGTLQVAGTSTFAGTTTVKNQANAEIDQVLWAGATASQKESLTYKDWNGNSQWYAAKDASNNWVLNSATGGLDSFKAYQSTNSGDTYINASNASGVVRVNYETGAGTAFKIYGGNSSSLYASFTAASSIQFPGLAAGSGQNCLQIDSSGYVTNTGSACGSGSGSGGSGTVSSGSSGQIAYYTGNGTLIGGITAVPVTSGGTGSATAQGAIQNLGGISATATSQQTVAGPLNANINGADVVTVFGAKGDCTGNGSTSACTDNHAAIQAAIDAAYASGGAVYFPSNPNASGQTVYYTSQPIDPKGVSMYGPPGAQGPSNDWASYIPVAVRGAPSKDVFDGVDPTSANYVPWHPSFTVRDLGIIVDATEDVSSSNTTRRPGRTIGDASITSGSVVLTSSTEGVFQPGDVGQAVTVAGASTSGATLSTTIASWQSATQVTLAVSAATTVTNAVTYISVMNLPVTQNIGNCGFVVEDKYGTGAMEIINDAAFENVVINTTSGGPNNTCGYLFQGQRVNYQTRWQHGFVSGEFGFAFIPGAQPPCQNGVPAGCYSEGSWNGLGDFNTFDQLWISAEYPFLAYDGAFATIRSMQISNADFGPEIVEAYGVRSSPLFWDISIPEQEPGSCAAAGDIALRIAGDSHHLDRFQATACSQAVVRWDASESVVNEFTSTPLAGFNISGHLNSFEDNFTADWIANSTINVTGWGNTLTTGRQAGPLGGVQPGRKQLGGGTSAVGSPLLARSALAFARTHDFIDKGATAYYLNGEDLWLWPNELEQNGPPLPIVADAASESGLAVQTTTQSPFSYANDIPLTIGSQIPAGKMRIYVKARASASGISEEFWAAANGTPIPGSVVPTLETTYDVYSFDIDTTGMTGQTFALEAGGWGTPSPAGTVSIAWWAVRPWTNDEPVNSLQIGSGTPMTGNHGTGASVQHSDGTGASGYDAFYNSDGSLTQGYIDLDVCGWDTLTINCNLPYSDTEVDLFAGSNGFFLSSTDGANQDLFNMNPTQGIALYDTVGGVFLDTTSATNGISLEIDTATNAQPIAIDTAGTGPINLGANSINNYVANTYLVKLGSSTNLIDYGITTAGTLTLLNPAIGSATATTQTTGDNTTAVATDAFVNASIAANAYTLPAATSAAQGGIRLASGQSSSTLAKVATTGAYSDLSGAPSLPTFPTGAVVGTTDTQTLTNKSIAGSEINSGTVGTAYGGTGQNESSATGIGQYNAGTYSVSAALANGTTATTQSSGDNSTKIATTAYVASPGAITPTTVTASGLITGGNDTTRTTSTSISTTSFTTTGLVLPTVPASTTKSGRCALYWQMSSTSYTATFGIGMSNAPTGLWGGSSVTYAAAGTSNWLAFSQTATAATAISTAATGGATNTTYRAEVDFTLQTGATNPVAITLYGEVSNTSGTLTIEPGSVCYWLP